VSCSRCATDTSRAVADQTGAPASSGTLIAPAPGSAPSSSTLAQVAENEQVMGQVLRYQAFLMSDSGLKLNPFARTGITADSIAYHMGWEKDGETSAVGNRDGKPKLNVQRAKSVLERLVKAGRLANLGKQQSPGSKRSVCIYCTPEFVLQCKAVLPDAKRLAKPLP
jgi:hypothetical protein